MLLSEIKNPSRSAVDAQRIVETVDLVLVNELFGGLGAMAGAVGNKVKQAGQAVASTYNKGEIQSLLQQYKVYKAKLVALIQKHPNAFGEVDLPVDPAQQQQAEPQRTEPTIPSAWQIRREGFTAQDQQILNELLGGLGALMGAAKNKAVQVGQQVSGTYVKGEALAILKKMAETMKALKGRGYDARAEVPDFLKLKRAILPR
jgi:hypothetical protein